MATIWQEIRSEIPCTKNHTYLMSAAAGPLHPRAFKRSRDYTENFLHHGDRDWEKNLEEVEQTRCRIAKIWNVKTKEIAFLPSTSMAMSIFALLLKDKFGYLDLVSCREEFPSSTIPWVKQGAKLRLADPIRGIYRAASFEKVLNDQTNVLVQSHVISGTGFRADLAKTYDFCEQHNLVSVINATQGAGAFPIDAERADFLCTSIHKWLMSSLGLCVAKVSEKHLDNLPIAGWLSQKDIWALDNETLDERLEASSLEVGCPSLHHILMLGKTLEWIEEVGGSEVIAARIQELVAYAKEKFQKEGIDLVYHFESKDQSGILVVQHPDPIAAGEKLREKNVYVTGRKEGLRVALHYFNNEEDIDSFVKAFKEIS